MLEFYNNAECQHEESFNAMCHQDRCQHAKCHYTECHGAFLQHQIQLV
jgi:hypothetical protein